MSHALPLRELPPSATTRQVPLLAKGFRPFFLLAAAFAAAIVPLWIGVFAGLVPASSHFAPIYWHAHEMVFGFTAAVVAGFLLTAVGNWTGRETLVGPPLLALAALWTLGRLAMISPDVFPRGAAAAVDLAFLPALMLVLGRAIVAANNRRNLVMLVVLAALFGANLMTHLDALGIAPGWERRGALVGIDVVVVLMLVICGRVLPMFTRNATRREGIRSAPTLDALTIGAMAALTAADAFFEPSPLVIAPLAAVTGLLAVARAARWGSRHVLGHPLLWILHVGYAWIPAGLLLRAAGAASGGVAAAMATHALTAGAIGALTLGMMARVSLGHTGRPIVVGRAMTASFLAVTLAAIVRVSAPLSPDHYVVALTASAALWCVAFAAYVAAYARVLVSPRADGKPG